MGSKHMDAETRRPQFKSRVIHLIGWWRLVSHFSLPPAVWVSLIQVPVSCSYWEGNGCSVGQKSIGHHPHQELWDIFPNVSFWYSFRVFTVSHFLISGFCCSLSPLCISYAWTIVSTPDWVRAFCITGLSVQSPWTRYVDPRGGQWWIHSKSTLDIS